MKILAIRGKNLASLEKEFEVDFTVEPLRSAGIFAISGNTGSGKSTLLDALCLSLFDASPRTSNVSENIALRDAGDKTVNQRDCRNILRRGAGEGFAEADFKALDGDAYRSRWSVRRAYGRPDCALQNSEIRLCNLSTGKEEQGSKSELLERITALLGLTFEQFARSALLAQGDFATFLKARQSEKAELLEKLTGTDIYSRISVAVYEKTKNAEAELNALHERIKSIELLTAEQLQTHESDKLAAQRELAGIKKETDTLAAQLQWTTENERFLSSVKQAEKNLQAAREAVTASQDRQEYIGKIEQAQDMRDAFLQLKNTEKQLSEYHLNLQASAKQLDETGKLLAEAELSLAGCEKERQTVLEKQQEAASYITRANELDTYIKTSALDKASKRPALDFQHSNADFLSSALQQKINRLLSLNQWFEANKKYEDVARRTELLVNLSTDARTAFEQKARNHQTSLSNRALLDEYNKQLDGLKKEAEHLNTLLPAEIAALRARLEEGRPCPVCGSLHHPVSSVENIQRMKEQELNAAKQVNSRRQETLLVEMERLRNEIVRLSALAENYAAQYDKARLCLIEHLSPLPELKKHIEQANGDIATAVSKRYTDIEKYLTTQTQQWQTNMELLKDTQEEIIQFFAEWQNAIQERLDVLTENKNNYAVMHKSLHGITVQTQQNIAMTENRLESLKTEINNWLEHTPQLRISTIQQLSELLSKDSLWIQAEKQALKTLAEAETVAAATLSERRSNLERHRLSEYRPADEETTADRLQKILSDKAILADEKTKRLHEITVILSSDAKLREQARALEQALAEKNSSTENWRKLNVLLGSANGNKFKEIAQGYTLEVLLGYANKHLQELAPRYRLQRIPDTLALQIVDTDMLNEIRTVHSLSGGESFLVSLALALGLSSLSSNRMKVESLFIDEGFGSLDAETLRIAMDALERLHTCGRKTGVISHVAEMTERIPVQIKIVKTSSGRSEVITPRM